MLKKVIILGAGLVGRTIALELSKDYQVTAVDTNPVRLKELKDRKIKTLKADLSSDSGIKKVIRNYDLVICALPGFMGFKALKSIIKAGKKVVDISFFPEDQFLLDKLAKQKGVTAIVDCGVAPGLANVILGYHNRKMKISNYKCMVGGLPYKREWPFEYKAFFSPIDVIAEYTRPARLVVGGKIIEKEALSDPEIINFEKVGELESFNTDGLRSLLQTMKIPNMVEKTMRYPGHIELMKIFRKVGLFGEKEIEIKNKKIKPVDLTARLLFPFWSPEKGEKDFTVMDVLIEGNQNGNKTAHHYFVFDEYDPKDDNSSMARTTGFTCCAAARYFLEHNYQRKGICPPEYLGEDENCFNFILSYLSQKKIKINHTEF
ncbi:MAG TPA: saccharopine dehydrogenase C-terminal domain-containing protein [Ignavibacteriaceae bacterium]|nr:saccharopine dehydrogenase C-terminal domain-containing protein [Ignavibacteriaceae bacterium]